MHDKLLMENYLLILKSTIEVYIHGTLESSNDKTRMTLKSNLNETLVNQDKTFKKMVQNNWYQVENIASNIINKSLNKLENEN